MNIVLLHGIFDTARIFRRMISALEAEGHRCFAPDMRPADARHGIHDLACFVERYIGEQLAPDEPFALIGFSMGGVIARQYMQALGGAARVTAFFRFLSACGIMVVVRLFWAGRARSASGERPADFLAGHGVLLGRYADSQLLDIAGHGDFTGHELPMGEGGQRNGRARMAASLDAATSCCLSGHCAAP